MKVIKRDGRAVEYNSEKIYVAIEKANMEVNEEKRATDREIESIICYIESLDKKRILVEDIQDIIEEKLMELGRYDLAKKYIVYRYTRALVRKQNTTDESILGLIKNAGNSVSNYGNSNVIVSVQRDLIAGEVSKDLTKRILLPEKITKAHDEGIIHFHAMEYFLQPIINDCFVNLEDMLDNGIIIDNKDKWVPKSFYETCICVCKIIENIYANQYGKIYLNIGCLGKYLNRSSNNIENIFKDKISPKLIEEVAQGIKIIKYEIKSLKNTYGKNSVILMFNYNSYKEFQKENEIIESEIIKQNIKNDKFICDSIEKSNVKSEGHFNYGVVSINLPQIALLVNNKEEEYLNLLDKRLDMCYEALMCRHYAMLGTSSDVSPIHWQNGAIARLKPTEKIDKLLKNGYSSLSLGYVGLDESSEIMCSKLGWNNENKEKFKNKIIKIIQDKVQKWIKITGIGFITEKIENDEANYRLYQIDKNNYERFLNASNINSYDMTKS